MHREGRSEDNGAVSVSAGLNRAELRRYMTRVSDRWQIEAAYLKVEGKKPATVPIPRPLLLGDMGKLYTWMWKEGYQADLKFCRDTIKDMLTFEQWLALKHRGAL